MADYVRKKFDEKGIPAFESPEGAAAAMWALYAYGRYLEKVKQAP